MNTYRSHIPHGAISELARETNISPGYITNLLKGRRHARLGFAQRLAAATDSLVQVWREDGPVEKRSEAVSAWADQNGSNHE